MFRIAAAFLFAVFLASMAITGAEARKASSYEPIIIRLERQLGELTYQERDQPHITARHEYASKKAVEQASIKISILLENKAKAKDPSLAEDMSELLPYAVLLGLSDVVETLLLYPEARALVDTPLPIGDKMHLWSFATVAPGQSMRVCGDYHFDAMLDGYRGYYGREPSQSPYKKIRLLLEKAGAAPRPEEARALWLNRCNPAAAFAHPGTKEIQGSIEYIPGARNRVANAPDILEAILAEIQAQETPQGLPKPRF